MSLGLFASAAFAGDKVPLPQGLTAEEREYIRLHRDEYLREKRSQPTTRAPLDVLPAPGEYQPMDGIVVAWAQFTDTLAEIVRETAEVATAYVVVDSQSEEKYARQELQSAGADLSKVKFIRATYNSVWIRDYGPNFVYTKDGDREIVDLVYNRPRPTDDAVPSKMGPAIGTKVHKAGLILPGGNIIFDGVGGVILTDMVFDGQHGSDPDLTPEELAKYMKDYFGVTQVTVLEQMNEDGTGHVDMYCKMLSPTTVIVGEYAKPSDGAAGNYEILNRMAEKLKNSVNGAGQPLQVFRIPMPRYDGNSYTHTNSVMVNGRVFVPTYGLGTDQAAIDVYKALLPGWDVIGIDANGPIGSNGALHCISHEMNGDPFEIAHTVPAAAAGAPIAIEVTMKAHETIVAETAKVLWRVAGEAAFQEVALSGESGVQGTFVAELPAQAAGTVIEYSIRAEDARGMYETSPEDASESVVHRLTVAAPAALVP